MAETRLGLPGSIHACLFDLDGVLTETATLHAKAWQRMFDGFLSACARPSGQPFVPFDVVRDYDLYVDGKPRDDGRLSFLASHGIQLPEGTGDDPPTAETIHGLGKRKNRIVLGLMREEGVQADPEHLPEEILLTEAFHRRFPDLPQMACFDTAFHHDLPRVAWLLPIRRRNEAQGVWR